MLTPLQFLGLPETASEEAWKLRVRQLLLEWHPDKNTQPNAKYIFGKVDSARRALMWGDMRPVHPILFSLDQRMPHAEVDLCECGWILTNRWLCESCGQFHPDVKPMPDASWDVKEDFWKTARRICVDNKQDTEAAKRAFTVLFGHRPVVVGRFLQRG